MQFENKVGKTLVDAKAVQSKSSLFYVAEKPEFLTKTLLEEATRQVEAAQHWGLEVEWVFNDAKAAEQVGKLFETKKIPIKTKVLQP